MTKESSAKVNKQGSHRLVHTKMIRYFFLYTNGFKSEFGQDKVKLWKFSTIIMTI